MDKLDDALHATGDAIGSRAGAVKDAVKQIAVDGVWGLVHDTFVEPWNEAGDGHTSWYQALGHGLAGDAGDVGHLFGGAFHLIEAPVIGRGGVHNVDKTIAKAYREGVDQPVATVFTAASLAQSEQYQGTSQDHFSPGRIFKGKLWKDAYQITQDKDRSLGQAFALMGSDDITDSAKVEQYQKGTLYKVTAGTLDATAPFLLDPLLPVAKTGNLARARYVTKPIRSGDDIAQIAASKRVQAVVNDMHDNNLDAAQIRHKYGFSPNLSVVLESAGSAEAKTAVLRHAMGDMGAINALDGMGSIADRSTYLQNALNRAMGQRDSLRAAGFSSDGWMPKWDEEGNLLNHDDWHLGDGAEQIKKVQQEINDLEGEQNLLHRWQDVHGELENTPAKTRANDLRYNVTRSEWYQGRNGAPLRVIFQMRPRTFINLDDPIGDVQVSRLLSHSSLDNAARDQFRSEYLRANSGQDRLDVLHRTEDAVVHSILDRHGYSDADKTKIMTLADEGRGHLQNALTQRETNFDGQGRDRMTLPSGEIVHLPLTVSQNQNVAALVDLDKVEKLAKRYAPERAEKLGLTQTGMDRLARLGEVGDDTLSMFYRLWKPSVLLRIAYPFRVALGEEQLRIAAMFGGLAQTKYLRNGFANNREDAAIIGGRIEQRISNMETKQGRRLTPQERVKVSREVEQDYNQNERIRGFRNVEYDGYRISPAFDGPGRKMATLNSSRASYDRNMGRDSNLIEGALAKELRGFTGTGDFKGGIGWKNDDPLAQAQWHKAYLDATMRHLGHDPVARKIIEQHLDGTRVPLNPNGEIKQWLSSAEGSKYHSELDRARKNNTDEWLNSLRDQVESYLPTDTLKQAALDKNMTLDLIGKEYAQRSRPVVHGEILAAHTGLSTLGSAWDRMVDRMYQALASGPTDVLSRHPAFNHSYTREVARQIDLAHGQAARAGEDHFRITQEQLDRIEERARHKALHVVKKNLYDIAETSDLGHALRYVSPFFNAWQEVLTVWAGIAKENFRVPVQLHNAWDAPDRAGLTTTDTNGNEYLTLPVPKWARDHFPGGALKDVDHLMMSKRGLNLIMTGLPGAGPVVGIPTALLLKDRPDIASNGLVQLLYPYGPPSSVADAFTPTTIRNLVSANADFDNATFKRMYVAIYNKQMVDYNLGKRSTRPDPAQIEAEAHAQSNLRSFLQFVLPSAPKFDTPYQPVIDAYQRLLQDDPANADQRFYDQFGVDYFQLTTHMSKSVNGVPPSLEAWKAQQKQKDLVAEHPELGSLILGDIPGSTFNNAVYQYQRTHRVGPGDERMQRGTLGVQDIVNDPSVRAGWLEYHKNMTILDDELERRGLKDYNAKGAEDLKALKKHTVAWMSAQPQYQGWWDDFGQRDSRKWDKRITALSQIAQAPSLSGRVDIDGLREYLDDRKVITDELARRKAAGLPGSLDAKANAGLAGLWESAVTQLSLGNPSFAALAHRFLDGDIVEVA